jgi:CRISPR-associated protein Cas8b1/Cst1 subtype I-B
MNSSRNNLAHTVSVVFLESVMQTIKEGRPSHYLWNLCSEQAEHVLDLNKEALKQSIKDDVGGVVESQIEYERMHNTDLQIISQLREEKKWMRVRLMGNLKAMEYIVEENNSNMDIRFEVASTKTLLRDVVTP